MVQLPLIRGMQRRLQEATPQPVYILIRGSWRRVRPWIARRVLADHFVGIPGRVHRHDDMLDTRSANSIARYGHAGIEAYDHIESVLQQHGRDWANVHSLLDYGCGYGRVMRWIAAKQPALQLSAVDVDQEAVRFCAIEFRARPYVVTSDVVQLTLPASFDVIWAGAVFTQLNGDDGRVLLAKLADALSPGGIMLFTTSGEFLPDRVHEYGPAVAGRASEIRATLAHGGIAFLAGDGGYGPVAFHARAGVRAQLAAIPHCELVSFRRRGWNDQQDVWAIRRSDPPR